MGANQGKFPPRSQTEIDAGVTGQQDGQVITRVAELADKQGVAMTEGSLSWPLTKAASPVGLVLKPEKCQYFYSGRAVSRRRTTTFKKAKHSVYEMFSLVGNF